MKPKDQLIKEIKKLKSMTHNKGFYPYDMSEPILKTVTVINRNQAISTIKSFMKGYKLIKRSVWIGMFMKSHKLKTYQEAIDKLCDCYRAWNKFAEDYTPIKKGDLLTDDDIIWMAKFGLPFSSNPEVERKLKALGDIA